MQNRAHTYDMHTHTRTRTHTHIHTHTHTGSFSRTRIVAAPPPIMRTCRHVFKSRRVTIFRSYSSTPSGVCRFDTHTYTCIYIYMHHISTGKGWVDHSQSDEEKAHWTAKARAAELISPGNDWLYRERERERERERNTHTHTRTHAHTHLKRRTGQQSARLRNV